MTKISSQSFKEALMTVLDEDGLSVEEVANMSGVSKVTLYYAINDKTDFVQRAIIRKIAEATNRKFVIAGDTVTFVKVAEELPADLSAEESEVLDILRGLGYEQRMAFIELLRATWRTGGNRKSSSFGEN